jgi:hypothetical protein
MSTGAELDEADDAPFVHLIRSAAECEPPAGCASFVFEHGDLAVATLRRMAASLKRHGRTGHDPAFAVERTAGLVKVARLAPEETDEWKAREAARRARQTPPRPVKKARTKSRKLRELIGEAECSA